MRPQEGSIDGRLYADGGTLAAEVAYRMLDGSTNRVWQSNPSPVGFTWAWALVSPDDGRLIAQDTGYALVPIEMGGRIWAAACDLAEFVALTKGLENLPAGGSYEVLTDSILTLNRMFEGWATASLPEALVARAAAARRRLGRLWPTRVDGHATARHYERGYGRTGCPVSRWNEYVDRRCNEIKEAAWADWAARYPWEGEHADQRTLQEGITLIRPQRRARAVAGPDGGRGIGPGAAAVRGDGDAVRAAGRAAG